MALWTRPDEVCGRAVETLQRGGSLCQRPAREDADGTVKDVDGKVLSENKYYRARGGTDPGEYVAVNMSLRMAAEFKSGRRPGGPRLAALVVFV